MLFDSRPTVAWPPTTVAWPWLFSKFWHSGWIVQWLSGEFVLVLSANDFRMCLLAYISLVSFLLFLLFLLYFLSDVQVSIRHILTTWLLPAEKANPGVFSYQMKDILKEKRNFDFGGKIPTRWFPMRETNSLFSSLATYLLLQEWFNPGNFDIISKLGIGRREFSILAGKFQLVDSLWGKQIPHYKHRRRMIYTVCHIIYVIYMIDYVFKHIMQFPSYCT